MIKKLSLILTLLIKSFALFSQTDSTIIYYKYLEDKDLINICELTGIQIQKIYCEDTLLKGKVFNIAIKEFKKGKINTNINLNINAKKQKIPLLMNGDTMFYEIDYMDKIGFGDSTKSVSLIFSGILKKDKFKLKIGYPGLSITQELKGKNNYSLRKVNSCSDNNMKVPINIEYPILAYTPPFDTGSNIQSYCLLGEENINDWYDKFNVKHFYVIYLEIK
jgi:hypothetical protein